MAKVGFLDKSNPLYQDDLASVVVEQIQKVYLDLTIFLVH